MKPELPPVTDLSFPRKYRVQPQPEVITVQVLPDGDLATQMIDLSHRVYDLEQTCDRIKAENDTFRGYFLLSGLCLLVMMMIGIGVSQQYRYNVAAQQQQIERGTR